MAPPEALPASINIHQIAPFISLYDGSFPIQDLFDEIREAKILGYWPDVVILKVANSKLQGDVGDMVRNRFELSHAPSFDEFANLLTAALHTDRLVSAGLQELMTCSQLPSETVDSFSAKIKKLAKQLSEWDLD